MPLILTLTSMRGGAPPERRTLSDGTLSLGRGTVADWVLADPERLLSKTHCLIGLEGSRYVLTDLSTNGVFVNGARQPTARDSRTFLTDGDSLKLGDYMLTVTESNAPAPPARPAETAWSRPGSAEDPFADENDPFGGEPGTMFRHPVPARAAPAPRTDDPFAPAPGRPSALAEDDDLFQGIAPDRSWQGAAQPDNADAVRHAYAAPKSSKPVSFDDLDLDALLGDEPPGHPTAPPPLPAPPPAPLAIAPAPAARAEPAPAPPAPPPVAAEPVADSGATLLAAFLEGAGVASQLPGADPQATLRAAGTVFRAMVEGLREVLMSRAAIKNELRVEQTMLRARNNNALKFSVTPDDAVLALLAPRPGYLPATEAAAEACRDIRSHEMAVMAGVQTALVSLLHRFDPATLQARLSPRLLSNLVPGARKAQTWELFCDTYSQIAREAEDDFQSVFGKEFAKAYDAQMRKM